MFHDVEQNTDNPCPCCGKTWWELRAGRVTGSTIAKVMANYGKAFGEPAKNLAANIAVEQLTGQPLQNEGYHNGHMDRGHAEEPIARGHYEDAYFVDVTNGGFYESMNTGCSPDGLVEDDGIIEIKSALPHIHYARIKRNNIDSAYKWQCLFNLRESGRKWLDFVSYCSNFPEERRLFVSRLDLHKCDDEVKKISDRLSQFYSLVAEIKAHIRG
ncbi:MAG: YqaJ viral recombinase family protein [Gammaproteobacteria bacterium]|nr:YqaJ viral recombinase family protein [Gammaproteobacteria bacterium]